MIAKDMKYTALYWALRFVEKELDVHVKEYDGYPVVIFADRQTADLGIINRGHPFSLSRHKDFVILELIDRLLSSGYRPQDVSVCDGAYDLTVQTPDGPYNVLCEAWDDYRGTDPLPEGANVLYTSRLVSGLLEYKGVLVKKEGEITPFGFCQKPKQTIVASPDFVITDGEVTGYRGVAKTVRIPDGVTSIGASAFWNNTTVKEVLLPDSLERIGGDCFYYCTNLERITIPRNVRIMGNNPFAGCPKLTLSNESPFYLLEDGVLYDREKTLLIYYPIKDPRREFNVPNSVICLGKHCFYACDHLERVTIPESVIRFENNPFSGCTKLRLVSHTPYYIVEDGVIYNRFKTTIVGCLNGTRIDCLRIPESVTLISRNSFWNCKGIRKIILTKNVDRIGYNPFAGCENLLIVSEGNPHFKVEAGVVFDPSGTHLLCATDRAVGEEYRVPDGVTHINRGVFSGCVSLCRIDFNQVTYIDKSSFTNCTGLTDVFIPDAVTYVGEWAFSYCANLHKICVNRKTFIDKNAFNECPVEIEWRK